MVVNDSQRGGGSSGGSEGVVAVVFLLIIFLAINGFVGHWIDVGALLPSTATTPAEASVQPVPPPAPLPQETQPCSEDGSRYEACTQAKSYGRSRVEADWGLQEWPCLDGLWTGESRWNPWAVNPSSSAFGIPQILPAVHGHPPGTELGNWRGQVDWGLTYIKDRYGTPCRAYELWQSRSPHWY
jgi:hypothetical protein